MSDKTQLNSPLCLKGLNYPRQVSNFAKASSDKGRRPVRREGRPAGKGAGPRGRGDGRDRPRKQRGPDPFRPFAQLRMVNGVIVMDEEDDKKGKGKR